MSISPNRIIGDVVEVEAKPTSSTSVPEWKNT